MAGMTGGMRFIGTVVLAGAALSAAAQDLAGGTETARRALRVCAACHGEGGQSKVAAYPNLAGQQTQYTIQQLKDFRSQTRAESNTQAYMWGVSALLDDETIGSLAEYYAAQKPAPGHAGPPRQLKLGRALFVDGIPSRGVRACAFCHGNGAEGAAGFPRLAGQHAPYLYAQLRTFSTQLRPHGVLMKTEVSRMTDAEMRAVAAYLQSL